MAETQACDIWNAAAQTDGELCPGKGLVLPFWSTYRIPVLTAGTVATGDYKLFQMALDDQAGQGFVTGPIRRWQTNMKKQGFWDYDVRIRALGLRIGDKTAKFGVVGGRAYLEALYRMTVVQIMRGQDKVYDLGNLWDWVMGPDEAPFLDASGAPAAQTYLQGACPRGAQPIPPLDFKKEEKFSVVLLVGEPITVMASGPSTFDLEARLLVEPLCG